jgi:hypothetical protein
MLGPGHNLLGSKLPNDITTLGCRRIPNNDSRAEFHLAPRIEKVELRSLRTIAKIVGTVICLGGAALMAFFKGPKLLGAVLLSVTRDWVKGGIYLVANAACVSVWYILQVRHCKIQ